MNQSDTQTGPVATEVDKFAEIGELAAQAIRLAANIDATREACRVTQRDLAIYAMREMCRTMGDTVDELEELRRHPDRNTDRKPAERIAFLVPILEDEMKYTRQMLDIILATGSQNAGGQ